MNWVTDPFSSAFMQRALAGGILVSVICSIVGTFVVLRGLAFMGDALSHGVIPGIAWATLIDAPGILGAGIAAGVTIFGVNIVTRNSRLSSDTAIGLLFVGMLALGVVVVSASDNFRGDIVNILFGDILGLGNSEIWTLAITALVVAGVVFLFHRPLLLLSFDPEQARTAGYSDKVYSTFLLFLVAGAIIVSFQTVGTLLVFAMLLAPASTGTLIGRRISTIMATAIVAGIFSAFAGLLLSFHYDLATSASIALTAVSLFFITLAASSLRLTRKHAYDPRQGSARKSNYV